MTPPPSSANPGDSDSDAFTAWPLVICIGVTKLITVLVVILTVRDRDSLLLTAPTLLPWVAVAFGLLSAPIAWRWRMRKVRRRRAQLIQAEWRSDEVAPSMGAPIDIAPRRSPD